MACVSAMFYMEDLGISLDRAEKVARFMAISQEMKPNAWINGDVLRVYFHPWSQNSLRVFHLAEKWFFDVDMDDVFATGFFYGTKHVYTLKKIVSCDTGNFSGSKTKARLADFAEVFYGKEKNRG